MTSPIPANTGKRPEVAKFLIPPSVSGAVQAQLDNLGWWRCCGPPSLEEQMACIIFTTPFLTTIVAITAAGIGPV